MNAREICPLISQNRMVAQLLQLASDSLDDGNLSTAREAIDLARTYVRRQLVSLILGRDADPIAVPPPVVALPPSRTFRDRCGGARCA